MLRVTVVAAAAVAVAVVGGSIANKAPNLVYEYYESGTNYLTYEIDLAELTEGTQYKVRVSNANFIVEYPIEGEGLTRQLVTGLTPYRRYDVDIIGVAEELGDIVYYSHPVYTNKEPKPKAVFDFASDFDIERGTIDISYKTYISDFYKTGSNTYFQISINGMLLVDDHELIDDYFTGEIKGLTDLSYFEAVAYTTYYDDLIEIGRTGYSPEFPEEFQSNSYNAVYSISEPKVTFGDEGFNLSIDTGFESTDSRDSYIIDIYKAGAIVETSSDTNLTALSDDLIASYEGNTKVFDIVIPGTTDDIDLYFTGVKKIGDTVKKFDTKKIYSYSFEEARKTAPKPSASVEFIDDFDSIDEIYNENYTINITDIFKTGSNYVVKELIENEVVNEINLEGAEYTGTFKNIYNNANIAVIVYSKYNDEEEIIVIGSGEKKVEHPEPFKGIEFSLYEGGFYIGMEYVNENTDKEFTLKVIEHEENNTDIEVTDKFVGRCSYEGGFGDDLTLADIKSFDVSVLYNDKTVIAFTVAKEDFGLELGEVDADSDGNIIIPYEFKMPAGATFTEGGFYFESGAQEYTNVEEENGNIIITELTSNLLTGGRADITYVMLNGIKVSTSINIDTVNIGANYSLDYYAHVNSGYDTLYIRYLTKLNDKKVNSGLSPVIIEDENESYPDSMDGEYYTVSLDVNETTGRSSISFKLANPGFESEVTTINVNGYIDQSTNTDYEADLGNYEVTADSDDRIRYFKVNNDDGTVNYYFNPQFNDKSNNKNYYRIEYSYKDENDITHYEYSEYLNSSTYSMLNMPNRDYKFIFKTYYVSNSGLYYDHEVGYKAYRDCILVSNDTVLYDESIALLMNSYSENNDTVINFKLNYGNLIFDEPITINYKNTDYVINLKTSSDPEVEQISDDPNGYMFSGEEDQYRYRVYVYDSFGDASYINIEFAIKDVSGTTPGTATVTYKAMPNSVLDNYSGMNIEDYKETITKTIGSYNATYDLENASFNGSDAWYSDTVTVRDLNFKSASSNDTIKAIAYFNGTEVGSGYYDNLSKEIYLSVDPAYSDVVVKFYEVKKQEMHILDTDYYRYGSNTYELIYNDGLPVYEKEMSLRKMNIATGVEVTMSGTSYQVTVTEYNSNYTSTDYSVKLYGYDSAGNLLAESDDSIQTESSAYLNYESIKSIDKIEAYIILKDYDIKAQYFVIDKPSIGNYSYDDLNDRIILSFDANIPDGATLQSGGQVTYIENQIDISSGEVVIDELDSNIVYLTFDYSYVRDGLTVTMNSIEVSKELEVSYDYDYSISASYSSSYHFTNDIDIDDISGTPGHYVYFAKLNIKPKVGGLYLTDFTNYEVTITKAGYKPGSSDTVFVSQQGDPETISGADINSHESIAMYHDITISGSTVTAINSCVLEFEIDGNQYKIEHIPIVVNTTSDMMSLSTESINNSITKNGDKVNLLLDNGFDSEVNSEIVYKVIVKDRSYNELYQSDYLNSDQVLIENLDDVPLRVTIRLYQYDGERYIYLNDNSVDYGLLNIVFDTEYGGTIYNTSSSGATGYTTFYKEMLKEDSQISIVINKDDDTIKQTLNVSINEFDKDTDYSVNLENNISLSISYSSGSYELTVNAATGYSSYLNTVNITVTDKYGNEQYASIERN